MKEKKYEIPAKLAYSDFLNENPPAEEYDILNTHEETSSSKKTYSKQLVLPKKVCYSCGKVVEVANPDSIFEMANNEAKLTCPDCKLDAEHRSRHESDHKFAVKSRRKSVIISAVIAAVVYAIFMVIALKARPRSLMNSYLYATPVVFYGVFSILFCLISDTPVRGVLVGGCAFAGQSFVKIFQKINIFGLFIFPYILAFVFIVLGGTIATSFVMSVFICPYSFIKQYAEV